MPTTPVNALPYPDLSDDANVPQDIQALALAVDALIAPSMPPGALLDFAGAAAPTGYLLCDGASYLRATYPALFAALGGGASPWGLPDGTHFNVPDFRGRVAVGKGTHASVDALGENDGVAVGSRTPKHKHTVTQPAVAITDPGHVHAQQANASSSGGAYPGVNGPLAGPSGVTGSAVTGITAAASGGTVGPQTGEPTDTPAYAVVQKIIKT